MYTSTDERRRSTADRSSSNGTATLPRRAQYTRANRQAGIRVRSGQAGAGAVGYAEPSRPSRTGGRQNTTQAGKGPRRLGSQQVVSVRGRMVNPVKRVTTRARLSIVAIAMMVGGIVFAIWLSGIATQQTFRVQVLTAEESQLNNELETLHRDLENVRSAAEIAGHAVEEGLEIPELPGILRRDENGDIVEDRPASAETRPIIDVNGEPVRPGQASSDPDGIGQLRERLESIPEGRRGIPYPQAGAPQAPEGAAAEVAGNQQPAPNEPGTNDAGAARAGVENPENPENLETGQGGDNVQPRQHADTHDNQAPVQTPYQPNFR
ncbi:hypothetical protein QP888_01575 [Corynebacterium sp. MSK297]|uniref:hypothetical protein n=1 Tax=Corynebacterium sp. MSK297 TaxID=3050221 RepID=UPI00254F9EAA|nr:hypothetical protein [Corynebacterium sp. MSK297]MDK8845222.1 hypothetical protein [Corynebacterium sp. MSK297]